MSAAEVGAKMDEYVAAGKRKALDMEKKIMEEATTEIAEAEELIPEFKKYMMENGAALKK